MIFPHGDPITGLDEYPEEVRYKCCAQFVVSKQAVKQRSLEDWRRIRRPLERDLGDFEELQDAPDDMGMGLSWMMGLLYEPMWHLLFGKAADLYDISPPLTALPPIASTLTLIRMNKICVSLDVVD